MILVTRPRQDAEETAKFLQKKGEEALIEPLINIDTVVPKHYLISRRIALFTSANAVRHLPAILRNNITRVFTVGDATSEAARQIGFENIISADGDVEDLFDLIASKLPLDVGKIVHYRGQTTKGNLCQRLCDLGYDASDVIVYSASAKNSFSEEAKIALEKRLIRSALFFSPRTAKIFMEILDKYHMNFCLENITAVCISSAAAEPLKQAGFAEVLIADRPTQSCMLARLFK